VEAEERERREKELQGTIEAERKGKAEAEARARIEAKARETVEADTRAKVQAEIENDMEKRAELEGKAQARAYMEAKAKAELEEEEKMRADQERKAREIAESCAPRWIPTTRRPSRQPVKKKYRRRRSIVGPLVSAFVAAIASASSRSPSCPCAGYAAKVERTMSGWLHDDVQIGSVKFGYLPRPHLRADSIAIGKQYDAKAATGRIFIDLSSLFGDRPDPAHRARRRVAHERSRAPHPRVGEGRGQGRLDHLDRSSRASRSTCSPQPEPVRGRPHLRQERRARHPRTSRGPAAGRSP
jgi:hypothetical protein